METLNNKTTDELIKNVKEYSEYNGTDCINHLNELMHHFTSTNDDIKTLISIKKDYDNAGENNAKESYLKQLFDELDGLEDYTETYLKELRFSVIQTNKLLTEIAVYNAKTVN